MRRTDNLDTKPQDHKAYMDLLKSKSHAWSFMRAIELSEEMRRMFPEKIKEATLKAFHERTNRT